jgi:hypothetical protein
MISLSLSQLIQDYEKRTTASQKRKEINFYWIIGEIAVVKKLLCDEQLHILWNRRHCCNEIIN